MTNTSNVQSENRKNPPSGDSSPVAVDCLIWSQLDDGLDYRLLNDRPAQPMPSRAEFERIIDALGVLVAKYIPYEAWFFFPMVIDGKALACCCQLRRGVSRIGRIKLILHAIATPVTRLREAGVSSFAQMAASTLWGDEHALTHGHADACFKLGTPQECSETVRTTFARALERLGAERSISVNTGVDETCSLLRVVPRAARFDQAFGVIAQDSRELLPRLTAARDALGIDFSFWLECPPRLCPGCGKAVCSCDRKGSGSETVYSLAASAIRLFSPALQKYSEEAIAALEKDARLLGEQIPCCGKRLPDGRPIALPMTSVRRLHRCCAS